MRLPTPCYDELGLIANRSDPHSEDGNEDGQSLRALDHYERAISALVNTTYSGLSSLERRELLASLCREKQRLGEENDHRRARP